AFLAVAAFLAAVLFGTAFLPRARPGAARPCRIAPDAWSPEAASTVSVPGAGTTVVSSSDGHPTRTIDPVTAVTTPTRSGPLPDDRRIRSPTFTMNGHLAKSIDNER